MWSRACRTVLEQRPLKPKIPKPLSAQVGGVIGKAGAIVKAIRDETGARIRVVEGVPNCDERVIVVSSRNDPASPANSAQVHTPRMPGLFCTWCMTTFWAAPTSPTAPRRAPRAPRRDPLGV